MKDVVIAWGMALALLGSAARCAWAGPGVPLVEPGTTMPDGNGRVEGVRSYQQLPDGRLVVGIDIKYAWSPITQLPLMENYGVYVLDVASGQLARDMRHDYPADQQGVPDTVGRPDRNADVPPVLDNGDRMYLSDDELFRFVEGQGLVNHGHGLDRILSGRLSVGPNGWIGATGVPAPDEQGFYACGRDGTYELLRRGQRYPGRPGLISYLTPVASDGGGGHLVFLDTFAPDDRYYVRVAPSQGADPHYPMRPGRLAVSPYGPHGLALFTNDGILRQDATGANVRTVLQNGDVLRGDHRVHAGHTPESAYRDPVFRSLGTQLLAEAAVGDSRTGAQLGSGVYLLEADDLLRTVLPGDVTGWGPAIENVYVEQLTHRAARYRYQHATAITLRAQLADGREGYLRLDRDGGTACELVAGQEIPGTDIMVEHAAFLDHTADGRSVYRISYRTPGMTGSSAIGSASYALDGGLRFDAPAAPLDTRLRAFGPRGGRMYQSGMQIWLVDGPGPAQTLVPETVQARGLTCEVVEARPKGFTPAGRAVFALDVRDPLAWEKFKIYYLHDAGGTVELLDVSGTLNGRAIASAELQMDEAAPWIHVAPGGLPVFRVQFEDGTSGLYALPEPGTVFILAAGAVWLLRKRSGGTHDGC